MEFFFGIFENDKQNHLPNLEDEKIALDECLRPLQVEGQMAITLDNDVGLRVLLDKLRDYQNVITIFHFSGHHHTDYIKTNDSELDDEDLISFLNNCPKLKLVVINGCSSEPILERLENVPIKIGTTEAVYDLYAKEFAIQFYKNIFAGNKIDGVKDRKRILESFDTGISTAFNLLDDEAKQSAVEKRGGGSLDKLESETFIISTKNDEDGVKFDDRNTSIFDRSSATINEEFESFINEKRKGGSIKENLKLGQAYQIYRHYPFNISTVLKRILSDDQETNGFNVQRFVATRRLYREFFHLLRVIVLTTIWDAFTIEEIKQEEKEFINSCMKTDHSELTLHENFSCLKAMIEFVPKSYLQNKVDIQQIFDVFMEQLGFLSSASKFLDEPPEHNGGAKEYHKIYKSSILVQGFILRFELLREFHFCSITKFEFKNYKKIHNNEFTYKALTYPVKTRPDNAKPRVLNVYNENDSTLEVLAEPSQDIVDQNSVYLMFKKESKSSYLLNLSPFLFDANSEDEDSDLVDLNYILNYDEGYSDWTFRRAATSESAEWMETLDGQKLIKRELKQISNAFFNSTS